MEKNMYETYEFLPSNSAEAEANQFFVLQNDGTFLINRQVQYVEVQDAKGVLENGQPCSAVYDVSSQQYYVDVDNSTELIGAVSDQFALPQDGTNSDFGNNYLLQSIPSIPASSVQMTETVTIDALKEFDVKGQEPTNPSSIQVPETTNFTEVTLNDEQYRTLELKGWVLLESAGKVYLLNTLGLHDITDNTKLIEDLRNDVEVIEASVLDDCTKNSTTSYGFEEIVTEPIQAKQEPQLLLPNTVAVIRNSYEDAQGTVNSQEYLDPLGSGNVAEVTGNQVETATDTSNSDVIEPTFGQIVAVTNAQPEKRKPSMIVRLKTNFNVEDIPNKIVLGKTASGKRLVAKVMNIKKPNAKVNSSKNNPQEPDNGRNNAPVMTKTAASKKTNKEAYYRAKEVESLMQKHMESSRGLISSAEDVKSADTIVRQLLNVPATRTPMLERHLIITKIVKTMKDATTLESESEPTLVTGRVARFDDKGEWHFIYVPDLLQRQRMDVSSDESETTPGTLVRQVVSKVLDEYLLHVHVVETKCPNKPTQTSINFSKKQIPAQMQLLSNKAIYACSACAKIFSKEKDLNEHQTMGCMEVEDEKPPLIIDTDKMSKQPTNILKTPELLAKSPCPYCNVKVKLSNYKRHLRSHIGPVEKLDTSSKCNGDEKAKPTLHKCKMCSTTYHHASTLSKHILSHHIQTNICLF